MVQEFSIGDKVRIVGEDGIHTIKEIPVTRTPLGWFSVVRFEDGGCAMVDSSGFTNMIKL